MGADRRRAPRARRRRAGGGPGHREGHGGARRARARPAVRAVRQRGRGFEEEARLSRGCSSARGGGGGMLWVREAFWVCCIQIVGVLLSWALIVDFDFTYLLYCTVLCAFALE